MVRCGGVFVVSPGGTVLGMDASVVVSPGQVSLGVLVTAVRGMRSRRAGSERSGQTEGCRRMWSRI